MEIVAFTVIAILVVSLIFLYVQFRNLSSREAASSGQVLQMFTMFKSDIESTIKNVSEVTR
ncbi:MAG: hypothetical protein M1339_04875, partial [Bacteroidetes bacterium]|nr:hypothetical protein [Bacteroidota bacterium]